MAAITHARHTLIVATDHEALFFARFAAWLLFVVISLYEYAVIRPEHAELIDG